MSSASRLEPFCLDSGKSCTAFLFLTSVLDSLVSSDIRLETEELLYSWVSLVSDIGGSLGLFLGFSFFAAWDLVLSLGRCLKIMN